MLISNKRVDIEPYTLHNFTEENTEAYSELFQTSKSH